ncbi:methylated-DNA--[protein]-cysteine S-methyltransferase [Eshraghiella crossota]|jgi:methylated-DNA-[protein]-cysteine S-methyltransferase|uniref:methylated-DNA--[protein]-cysteine S-methyltransferase n=1 Tax=Eshraghiella crossota TaxID=45851 RepID=UPI003AB7B19F
MIYTNYYNSPIGRITMASEGTALIGLWFEGQKYFADSIKEECTEKDLDIFDDTSRWLDIYFSGKEPDFTPKILITGTPFRKSVAEIMLTIPYGKTMTYGEIANVIAKEKGIAKMSAQAVGGAVGHNSISIIIPCHRVVGTNGSLTGYAGGLDKKIQLLKLEKTDTSGLFVSKKGTVL